MGMIKPPVIDYEGSDYQDSFWQRGNREYEDRVEAIALKRLLPDSGEILLEIGAGAGRNTPRYSQFKRVVLLDYSSTQLQQAQARLGISGRYIYVAADAYKLPFMTGVFDVATMIRTIHHIVDVPAVLTQVRKVLKPGAYFILEFANKRNLKAIFRYLAGRQNWSPFTMEPIEFVELNFDFHPLQMRRWLDACGLQVERQLTVSHFRLGLFKRLVPLSVLVSLDSLAQLTGDLWQLSPSVFTRCLATGHTPIAAPNELFSCPLCNSSPLIEVKDGLMCKACQRVWPLKDGIYYLRE